MAKVTQEHTDARRDQILDAAWASFSARGYYKSTMQDIADEAGISVGAIYRYYPSKEAVLKAISDRSTDRYRELVQDIQSESSAPMDILSSVSEAMLNTLLDPSSEIATRLEIELRPEVIRNPTLLESARVQLRFWRTTLTGLMNDAQRRGQLKAEVDPETLVILSISAFEGLRQWALIDPAMFKPREMFQLILTLASNPVSAKQTPAGNARKNGRKAEKK